MSISDMVSTSVSEMDPTSTSSMESDSTPPDLGVLRTPSGLTLPIELRRKIYRFLFKGTVIELTWGNYIVVRNPTRPKPPNRMKAIHAQDSGYGILFASKDSQKESAAEMYLAVTWHMTNVHPDTPSYILNSYDRYRFQRLSWNDDIQPKDCHRSTWIPKDIKCLSFTTQIWDSERLKLVLPPHHMEYTALLTEIEAHLRRSWGCDATDAIRGLKSAVECTIWCEYPPYTVDEGKIKVEDQTGDDNSKTWSGRVSPTRPVNASLLANTWTVDFRRE